MTINIYDYALALFTKEGVPNDLCENMAYVAVYYCQQTNTPVDSLIINGQLDNGFLSALNSVKTTNNQFGVITAPTTPTWENNIVLNGSIREALTLY